MFVMEHGPTTIDSVAFSPDGAFIAGRLDGIFYAVDLSGKRKVISKVNMLSDLPIAVDAVCR